MILMNATSIPNVTSSVVEHPSSMEWIPVGITLAGFAVFSLYLILSWLGIIGTRKKVQLEVTEDESTVIGNKQTTNDDAAPTTSHPTDMQYVNASYSDASLSDRNVSP